VIIDADLHAGHHPPREGRRSGDDPLLLVAELREASLVALGTERERPLVVEPATAITSSPPNAER
jgi:hypothetical protein